MAKDRKKLIHIHSSISDKQPTPQSLEVGEIAVNNAANQEFLSIKNSEDKVKRFSSDEQMITWMEKKEVMPYVGYVRGGAGPSATSAATPTADNYGSYGILESDLSGNTSEIVIKLNQVVASSTTKHERVNGSKDKYGEDVNPTTDSGVNDGAGFFIDMSRYAMQGANPEFSGITNTCYTNLNGTTKIKGVNGACGSLLEITVNSAKTDIETANTEITSATTVIGTNTTTISGNTTLSVSGTTTENKNGNVTENNLANKTENTTGNVVENTTGTTTITRTGVVTEDNKNNVVRTTSGTTTETFNGQVTENNQNGYTVNTTGNVIVNITGTTTETKVGNVTENHSGTTTDNNKGNVVANNQADYTVNTTGNTTFNTTGTTTIQSTGDGSDVIVYAKDDLCETSDDVAAFKGANTTNIGSDCANADQTKTLNVRANTADTRVTSAYTSATTATTIIGTANTSATTATLSGNDLTINEASSISAKTPSTTISGTNFTLNETNTTINSCGKVEITTDSYSLKQCSASGGSAEFEFCNGYTVKSNRISLQQCGSAGTISISAQTQNIDGGNITINESGNTAINTIGTTNVKSTGNTNIETNGANNKVTIQASGTGGDVEVFAKDTLCMSGGSTAALVGTTKTNIGKNCSDAGQTTTLNLNGTTINETGTTVNISGSTAANVSGATVVVSGNTTNISGATTLNLSGKTVNVDATDIDVDASNNYCLSAATKANIYGKATNIGIECGGSISTATTIEGTTVGISGNTTNISGVSVNVSGGSITEISTGKTCITAGSDLNIGGDANTNIGYNCAGTGIANNTNIFASTAVTINAPTTNITGNTYLSGNTYFHKTCTGLTNNEIDAAFCEVLSRGAVTIEKNTSPTDPQLATVYTVKQNGAVINTIEVAKDQFLQNAEVVKNTSGEWVIRLTWWIYDPDSGTHTTATTDVNASELVKDLTAVNPSDNGTALNHNVSVNAWYDATSGDMKFSAETTPNMHVGNMYVTGTTSASTVSGTNVNGGTISGTTVKGVTISGTNITASDAIRANNVSASTISATTFTGAMSKKLTWAAGAFTADTTGYNGSADKTITVPTAISHLATRGKLTITHNGLSDTYDPASDKSITLPHSALTFSYGNVSAKTGSDSYNTSAAKSITIPTSIDDLKNYNGSCVEIGHNVCVTGTITATQAIYSSDRNLKNNIKDVEYKMVDDAHNVRIKQFNFKSEPENLIVGVIAQEVEEHNLGDFVYTKEDGNKAVDYTSLMMLKIKYLENENEYLKAQMAEMRLRMENLENKINNQ